jgi:hypothetical protein
MTQLCVPPHLPGGYEIRGNLVWDRMRCDRAADSLVHVGVISAETEHQRTT